MSGILRWYNRCVVQRPLVTLSLSSGVLMSVGDLICQTAIEKRSWRELDIERNSRFLIFGTCFLGPVLRTWYLTLDRAFKVQTTKTAFQKVLADQTIAAPIICCIFLSTMDFWKTRSMKSVEHKLKETYVDVMITNYKIWPLAQLINFKFVPSLYRVIYVQVVALFWNVYLAYKSETTTELTSETEEKLS